MAKAEQKNHTNNTTTISKRPNSTKTRVKTRNNNNSSITNKPSCTPYTLPTTYPTLQTNHSLIFIASDLILSLCPLTITSILFVSPSFELPNYSHMTRINNALLKSERCRPLNSAIEPDPQPPRSISICTANWIEIDTIFSKFQANITTITVSKLPTDHPLWPSCHRTKKSSQPYPAASFSQQMPGKKLNWNHPKTFCSTQQQ